MSDYQKIVSEHLRITILRLCNEQPDYALNESVLLDMTAAYGFAPSRDSLVIELAWLRDAGLISLSGPEHCRVATLTQRGQVVAQCRATVPGVNRPRPVERA